MNTTSLPEDPEEQHGQGRHGARALLSDPYVLIALVFGMVGAGMMADGDNAGLPFLVIALSFLTISFDGSGKDSSGERGTDGRS